VQVPSGSFNVSPGRELGFGDEVNRMADTIRRWAETAHGEKLNCERRVNRFWVNSIGDGAKPR
jgi:hypothetical protein